MDNRPLIAIGRDLRSFREQAGKANGKVSQQVIAKRLGCSRQQVSDMERGVYEGGLPLLSRYMNYAGLDLCHKPKATKFPQLHELDSFNTGASQ